MFGEWVVAVHIIFMVAGIVVADGMGFLLLRIVASRDVAAMRTALRVAEPVDRIVPLFFVGGLIFGLVAVFTLGFNPLEPWLLIAYALFVIQFGLSLIFLVPWQRRLTEAVSAPDADATSGSLATLVNDGTPRTVFLIQAVLAAAFIVDMVVKPFSDRTL